MLFCIVLLHAGFLPALFVFLTWSLPGAIGMCALSIGVQRINQLLPAPAYALLSGLNSSTVGIIALAGTQLAEKAIKSKFLRVLVIFGACAGLCYNALWYFPILMLAGGSATVVWELWLARWIGKTKAKWRRRKPNPESLAEENNLSELKNLKATTPTDTAETQPTNLEQLVQRRTASASAADHPPTTNPELQPSSNQDTAKDPTQRPQPHEAQTPATTSTTTISLSAGLSIIFLFFASFAAILIVRGTLHHPPHALSVFANFYLAGTIIFGGGPVVIPLLREYVVQPGWVSARDFLIGLAIIQAFPGPNFNFAVFLGGLAVLSGGSAAAAGNSQGGWTVLGAFLGFVGIFVPGMALAVGVQAIWGVLRRRSWVVGFLKGVNATAVGLIFTAVYRLWQIGFLNEQASSGESLGESPWWLVVSALTYCASRWFGSPAAVSIIGGGVLGLVWYGAVGRFQGN